MVDNDDEGVPNPYAEQEEVFTEDELAPGGRSSAREEQRRIQRNEIRYERRRILAAHEAARIRDKEEEDDEEEEGVEEMEGEVPAIQGGIYGAQTCAPTQSR